MKTEVGKEEVIFIGNDSKTIKIRDLTHYKESNYQYVFNQKSRQKEVFTLAIKDCVDSVFQGYNSTIFAYGQTGSGKTFTIFGDGFQSSTLQQIIHKLSMRQQLSNQELSNQEQLQLEKLNKIRKSRIGIIPRCINQIFDEISQKDLKCTVYMSLIQIYNEQIYDMLSDKTQHARNQTIEIPLKIREDKIQGIYLENLSEYIVSNKQQCLDLLMQGEKIRAKRSTRLNILSSRSHSIFQLLIESDKADEKGMLKRAKLNIGDLAGSEKIYLEEFPDAQHMNELKNINLSLTYLGKVISMLAQNSNAKDRDQHIPFRNSKLTRILQDSLGGNTRTCLIANVSPIIDYIEETISTLKFADRAQNVQMKISKNEINAQDDALIQKLQKEIQHLKDLLQMRRKGDQVNIHQQIYQLKEENERLRAMAMTVADVEQLKQENKEMRLHLQNLLIKQSQLENEKEQQIDKLQKEQNNRDQQEDQSENQEDQIFITQDDIEIRDQQEAIKRHQKSKQINEEVSIGGNVVKNEVFINNALLFSFDEQYSQKMLSKNDRSQDALKVKQKLINQSTRSNNSMVNGQFWEQQVQQVPMTNRDLFKTQQSSQMPYQIQLQLKENIQNKIASSDNSQIIEDRDDIESKMRGYYDELEENDEKDQHTSFDNYQIKSIGKQARNKIEQFIELSQNVRELNITQQNDDQNQNSNRIFSNIRKIINPKPNQNLVQSNRYGNSKLDSQITPKGPLLIKTEDQILPDINSSMSIHQSYKNSIQNTNNIAKTIETSPFKSSLDVNIPDLYQRLAKGISSIQNQKSRMKNNQRETYSNLSRAPQYSSMLHRQNSYKRREISINQSGSNNVGGSMVGNGYSRNQANINTYNTEVQPNQSGKRRNIINLNRTSFDEQEQRLNKQQQEELRKANQRLKLLDQLEQQRKAKFEQELDFLKKQHMQNQNRVSYDQFRKL
ncbi:kinesin motor domain containing protein [Stylonychia lemnae]|uniref:Kinesin motor domain containing protein n=1 Tax=Stylonychia lemnae TaxID=5949 RepID=A0A077ZVZ1_STYLE|nr:kinesin motor domain containing protein [Stylonychia lemnae]|eukprot:CDW74044.1 kinesin motor domain containing protein [Stylonychia lemnae]